MKRTNAALFACALLATGCSGAGAGQSIALGPDNSYWTVEPQNARVVKLDQSGAVHFFTLPDGSAPTSIVAGPDGNMWFTEPGRNRIGRVTMSGAVSEFRIPSDGANPTQIVSSPPNRIWFTESNGKMGTLLTDGSASEFSLPATAQSIAPATDGGVVAKAPGQVIHVSPSGAVKVLTIK